MGAILQSLGRTVAASVVLLIILVAGRQCTRYAMRGPPS